MSRKRCYTPVSAAEAIANWETDDEGENSDEENEETDHNSPTDAMTLESSEEEEEADPATFPSSSERSNEIEDSARGDSFSLASPTSLLAVGRDETKWESVPNTVHGRAPANNIFTARPGVPSSVKSSVNSAYDAWKHFVDEKMLRAIVRHTVNEARRVGDDQFELSVKELEVFIGLQYARGLYGKTHPCAFLWNKEFGIPIFHNSMSRDRFKRILRYLRFDDKTQRQTREERFDKFAPIRDLFEVFVLNCKSKYVCDYSLTVDEQLLPCKNRCSFISYLPSKPDKYGIKFWVLTDVKTKYVLNIIPYLGAQDRTALPLTVSVVLDLTSCVIGKGYNVTCDNFFTSLQLVKKLRERKISLVGTIRRSRRELCLSMTEPVKGNLLKSSFFYNPEAKCLFVKYQPKKNKSVCLISSMHSKAEIADGEKKKPEVICFYNKNKVGVDVFDQMSRLYSCHSSSRRWPLAVWANILDIAGINAHVVYEETGGMPSLSRRNFLLGLIKQLTGSQSDPEEITTSEPASFSPLRKRRKCGIPYCSNMTLSICKKCNRPTCGSCARENSKVTFVNCSAC
jgi:hypothetical protein